MFCFGLIGMMCYFNIYAGEDWQIRGVIPSWPLGSMIACHIVMPIVLNPNLMLFTW
jgi:hypothetical protein